MTDLLSAKAGEVLDSGMESDVADVEKGEVSFGVYGARGDSPYLTLATVSRGKSARFYSRKGFG